MAMSFAFSALSTASICIGSLCLAAPAVVLSSVLPTMPPGPLDEPFLRIAGATLLISAAVEYCIKVLRAGGTAQCGAHGTVQYTVRCAACGWVGTQPLFLRTKHQRHCTLSILCHACMHCWGLGWQSHASPCVLVRCPCWDTCVHPDCL